MDLNSTHFSKTKKLTVSAMVIALYVCVMYITQGFAFGAYQIRIATALYALAYCFPFLVMPLAFSNFLSNTLFGGLGPIDMIGGFCVGLLTSFLVYLIRRFHLPQWLVILPVAFVPGLGIPTYLSALLNVPYLVLAASLCVGQLVAGIVGFLLVKGLSHYQKEV